ncbi:MAG: hypothetical protein IKT79_02620, partial [Akkermansia sp.]|nr:hypothetical protein [Akkermansia sp.]
MTTERPRYATREAGSIFSYFTNEWLRLAGGAKHLQRPVFRAQGADGKRGQALPHVRQSRLAKQIAHWESLKTPGPPQIGSCGGNTIGVLDFSPTFIIKPYHQKGGTEVPPYDIDKLLFIERYPHCKSQIRMRPSEFATRTRSELAYY